MPTVVAEYLGCRRTESSDAMKHIKFITSGLPKIIDIGDDRIAIYRFTVAAQSGGPAVFVLAAGKQKKGNDFESGVFGREVDLSDFYRTEEDFAKHMNEGFQVTDAFFERTEAKRVFIGLSEMGLVRISERKN